jgi:hypothetical protein
MTEQAMEPMSGVTDVVLKMAPPGAEVGVAPGQSTEPGFGVAWKARDAGGGRRIKELVRRMERLGGVEPTAIVQ